MQDILAVLKTLGYHWEINPDGYNWAAFAKEQTARKELTEEADAYLKGRQQTSVVIEELGEWPQSGD